MDRQLTGKTAEQAAALYLADQGMTLIKRNYHCRTGELDLIMNHGGVLVFAEVRFRRKNALVSAAESVSWRKQQRIIRAARHFLHRYGYGDFPCRFDVVCVTPGQPRLTIDWIPNAFDASS